MRIRAAMAAFLVVGLVGGRSLLADQATSRPSGEKELVDAANRFAVGYFQGMGGGSDNAVAAPYGVFTFLSILREGANAAGAQGLDRALGVDGEMGSRRNRMRGLQDFIGGKNATGGSMTFDIASQLWLDKTAKPQEDFIEALQAGYDADVAFGDFGGHPQAVRWSVDKWMRDRTRGMLGRAGDFDPSGCRAALVNAIYFHASWVNPFDAGETKNGDFHVTGDRVSTCPMMHAKQSFEYFHGDGIQLVSLPYVGNEPGNQTAAYEFIAIIPDDPGGFSKLEANLDPGQLERWVQASVITQEKIDAWTKSSPADTNDADAVTKWGNACPMKTIILSMPRFDEMQTKDAREVLRDMPGGDPLGSGLEFPAWGLERGSDWKVDQAARIVVDETGTSAVAATFGGLFGGDLPAAPIVVDLDHPFIYLVREKTTGLILFMGRVCDPSGNGK